MSCGSAMVSTALSSLSTRSAMAITQSTRQTSRRWPCKSLSRMAWHLIIALSTMGHVTRPLR